MLVVNSRLRVPLRELRFTFARSSGPGGQRVNKANTKATLRWSVGSSPSLPEAVRERFVERFRRRISSTGELVISSQRFRDRGRNVADCLEKLRRMLQQAASPPRHRRETRPTRASVEQRLRSKRATALRKKLRQRPGEPSE